MMLPRPHARSLRHANQFPQDRIDGLPVGEMRGHIGREKDQVRSYSIPRGVFAAHPALQFGQVVLPAQFALAFSLLNLFLHNTLVLGRFLRCQSNISFIHALPRLRFVGHGFNRDITMPPVSATSCAASPAQAFAVHESQITSNQSRPKVQLSLQKPGPVLELSSNPYLRPVEFQLPMCYGRPWLTQNDNAPPPFPRRILAPLQILLHQPNRPTWLITV
jgi:hypothetical protein